MAGPAPGVSIIERPAGSRTIAGVPKSDTVFIGMAERGPLNTPTRIFSPADFERVFGDTTAGELETQVRMFFLNGGGTAWVVRVAADADPATVTLDDVGGTNRLTLTAIDDGNIGNTMRVVVDYITGSPLRTFNLSVFRVALQPDGTTVESGNETHGNLSMDPGSPRFVEAVVNGSSAMITADADVDAVVPAGVSIGGRVFTGGAPAVVTAINNLLNDGAMVRVSIANHPALEVTLPTLGAIGDLSDWGDAIVTRFQGEGILVNCTVSAPSGAADSVTSGRLIRFESTTGAITIASASSGDAAANFQFGTAAGGIEGDAYGDARPAPNGLTSRPGNMADGYRAIRDFAAIVRNSLTTVDLADSSGDATHSSAAGLSFDNATDRVYNIGSGVDAETSLAGIGAALDELVPVLNSNTNDRWRFSRTGYHLTGTPTFGGDNASAGAALTSTPADVLNNILAGAGRANRTPLAGGDDGDPPTLAEYADAFEAVEREVEVFSLMVLSDNVDQGADVLLDAYRSASAFCAQRKALLLVDPPASWTNASEAENGVDELRIGMATENASVRWPRLVVSGRGAIGPSGSIAGLMARIDASRGIWKAAAGYEATIRGVTGLEQRITDAENGILNPKAMNAMRVFPPGVVSWGARTLAGADELANDFSKYEPVRRTTLFIEQSLQRGLGFAVFEPNDEPLWAQIRLAAGSFMNGLFRQGAFAGGSAGDAFFVNCDATTTTPTDQNLGIVNVVVGFAPLKPAEFVVVTITHVTQALEL